MTKIYTYRGLCLEHADGTRSEPQTVEVYLSWDQVERMARQAIRNGSQRSGFGPVLCKVVKRKRTKRAT